MGGSRNQGRICTRKRISRKDALARRDRGERNTRKYWIKTRSEQEAWREERTISSFPSSNGRRSGGQAWYSIPPNPRGLHNSKSRFRRRRAPPIDVPSVWPSSWTLPVTGISFTSMSSLVRRETSKMRYKNKIWQARSKTSIHRRTIITAPIMNLRTIW